MTDRKAHYFNPLLPDTAEAEQEKRDAIQSDADEQQRLNDQRSAEADRISSDRLKEAHRNHYQRPLNDE